MAERPPVIDPVVRVAEGGTAIWLEPTAGEVGAGLCIGAGSTPAEALADAHAVLQAAKRQVHALRSAAKKRAGFEVTPAEQLAIDERCASGELADRSDGRSRCLGCGLLFSQRGGTRKHRLAAQRRVDAARARGGSA